MEHAAFSSLGLGRALRAERRALGLTQQAVADAPRYPGTLGDAGHVANEVRPANLATLGIEMAPHMPTNPENARTGFLFNYAWWADHRDELDARFQAWLGQ